MPRGPQGIRGIRQSIPSGFAIGRQSPGQSKGQPGLVPLPPSTQQAIVQGSSGKATSGGGSVGFGFISSSFLPTTIALANTGLTLSGGPAYTIGMNIGQTPGVPDDLGVITGNVGEVRLLNSNLAGPGLTTGIVANMCSLSLSGGDWDVWGNVVAGALGPATVITDLAGGLSLTSMTFGTDYLGYAEWIGTTLAGGASPTITIPTRQYLLHTTTTVYMVIFCNFSGGVVGASGGYLMARRTR